MLIPFSLKSCTDRFMENFTVVSLCSKIAFFKRLYLSESETMYSLIEIHILESTILLHAETKVQYSMDLSVQLLRHTWYRHSKSESDTFVSVAR